MPARVGNPCHRRAGFTLSEILIATAVLGVGLAMVMAIFPAAIEINKDSTNDVLGTIICQNGLAAAKSGLTYPVPGIGTTFDPNASYPNGTTYGPPQSSTGIASLDCRYPAGDSTATRGFLILARQVDRNRDDYQIVVVAYQKSSASNGVKAALVRYGGMGLLPGDSNNFQINKLDANRVMRYTPVFDRKVGTFATAVQVVRGTGSTGIVLDHSLSPEYDNVDGSTNPPCMIVVAETDSGGNVIGTLSPATSVLVARTSLRPR